MGSATLRMHDVPAGKSVAEYAARYPFARETRLMTEPCILEKKPRTLGVSLPEGEPAWQKK